MSKLRDAVEDALKKAGLDIVAVIRGQRYRIRLAVTGSIPGVPHQFCHFHVLSNTCLPITDMDRHLKNEVRKRIRQIALMERALSRRDDAFSREGANACLLLRSLLIYPGTISLNFGGMKVFEHLTAFDGVLRRMLATKKDGEIKRLSAITSRWRWMEAQYRDAAGGVIAVYMQTCYARCSQARKTHHRQCACLCPGNEKKARVCSFSRT